jgi:hypothetical protein
MDMNVIYVGLDVDDTQYICNHRSLTPAIVAHNLRQPSQGPENEILSPNRCL